MVQISDLGKVYGGVKKSIFATGALTIGHYTYKGYNFYQKNKGPLLAGISALALATAAFSKSLIKKAAALAVVGFIGYNVFFNKSALASIPTLNPSAGLEDNALKAATLAVPKIGASLKEVGKSIIENFRSAADNAIAKVLPAPLIVATLPNGLPKIFNRAPITGSVTPDAPKTPETNSADAPPSTRTATDAEIETKIPSVLDMPKLENLPEVQGRSPISMIGEPRLETPINNGDSPRMPNMIDAAPNTSSNLSRPAAEFAAGAAGGSAISSDTMKSHYPASISTTEADTLRRINSIPSEVSQADQLSNAALQASKFEGLSSKVILGELKNILKLAKASRLGANVTGAGVGIGVLGFGLNAYAAGVQMHFVNALEKEGIITPETKNSYIETNLTNMGIITSDLTASTVFDPIGYTAPITYVAEKMTQNNFRDWIDIHGKDSDGNLLSQDIIDGLGQSIFVPNTVHEDIVKDMKRNIPDEASDPNDVLYDAIVAKQELVEFGRQNRTPGIRGITNNPEQVEQQVQENIAWHQEATIYRDAFFNEVDKLMDTPEGTTAYLNTMKPEDRLKIVDRLTISDDNLAQNEAISAHVSTRDKNGWLSGFFGYTDAKQNLLTNPELMTNYIVSRMHKQEASTQSRTNELTAAAIQTSAPALVH